MVNLLLLVACLTPEGFLSAYQDATCNLQDECWEEWGNSEGSHPDLGECIVNSDRAASTVCRDSHFHADKAAKCIDYLNTVDCGDYYSDIGNGSRGTDACNAACSADTGDAD